MTPFLIGIAGGTASGKSTLARRLALCAGSGQAEVIELDWYYRCQAHVDFERRASANYDHPDAVEFSLLIQHLRGLRSGVSVDCPLYDFASYTRALGATHRVEPRRVVIVEGILLFCHPDVRALLDTKIFTTAADDARLQRRIERDVRERGRTREGVVQQWEDTVHPMHMQFCEPARAFADRIVEDCGGTDAEFTALWEELSEEMVLALQPVE
jgi:uridine kinase